MKTVSLLQDEWLYSFEIMNLFLKDLMNLGAGINIRIHKVACSC